MTLIHLMGRFGLVGLANTAVSFLIITLALHLGANPYTANAIGYCAGLALSYSVNRHWTFRTEGRGNVAEVAKFLGAFAISYAANLLILRIMLSGAIANSPIAHIPGMLVYSAVFCSYHLEKSQSVPNRNVTC